MQTQTDQRQTLDRPQTSLPAMLLAAGVIGTLALTFLGSSASVIWDFRWFPAFILTTLLIAGGTISIAWRAPFRLTIPGLLILILLIGLWLGSMTGPFPRLSLLYSFPLFTGFIWCLTATCSDLPKRLIEKTLSPKGQLLICSLVSLWCLISLFRFIMQDVMPAYAHWRELDQSAGGGLFSLLRKQGLRQLRNAHPFGHMNYTSGFLLLVLPLLWIPKYPNQRSLALLRGLATLLGGLVLISLQSRNTLAGLFLGAAAVVYWKSRRKKTLLLQGVGLLSLLAVFYAASPRFHGRFFQESSARWGVWQLAWNTGVAYFPWGTGEGLAPEVSDQLARTVSAKWPSLLQFHHGWLHLWSAGGILALAGITGLTLWIIVFLLHKAKAQNIGDINPAPSLFALFAYFMVMLSDYQFDLLPLLFLWGLHLGILTVKTDLFTFKLPQSSVRLLLIPAMIPLIASLTVIPAAYRSRLAMERAGSAWERNDIPAALDAYEDAHAVLGEAYPLTLKAHLLAQNPEQTAEAIRTFERSLAIWPHQIIPLDSLTALWLQKAGQYHQQQNPEQEQHALAQAEAASRQLLRIAPHLSGVFSTHALIRSRQGAPDGEVVGYLLQEVLHRGHMVVPGILHRVSGLGHLEAGVIEKLMALDPESENLNTNALYLLQGYAIHLHGLPPETHPTAVERFEHVRGLNPSLGLIDTTIASSPEEQHQALHRFWVYLTRHPYSLEQTRPLLQVLENENPFQSLLRLSGQTTPRQSLYAGHALRARHPFAPPIQRPSPTLQPGPGLQFPTSQ